jgi:FKBP-type peptidyl-prolyl cis-trans isomerase (trigger factor)
MRWEHADSDDGCHHLSIEADWSELADDYDDIVSEYAAGAVPGFRPGKAPRSAIESRFQREIASALSDRAAQRFGRRAIEETGTESMGAIEVEEIECTKEQPFRARIRFHPVPALDLPDLGRLQPEGGSGDPRDQIALKLLDLVKFEIPDSLVKDELAMNGLDEVATASPEWQAAGDRVRLTLILKQIARREGIEVDEQDVSDRIAEKAKEFGTTTKSLRAELEKGGGIQRLRDMLLAESTLEYVLANHT